MGRTVGAFGGSCINESFGALYQPTFVVRWPVDSVIDRGIASKGRGGEMPLSRMESSIYSRWQTNVPYDKAVTHS